MVYMKIAWHKRGVPVSKVLNLASGYEPVFEALFNVGVPAKERKGTIPSNRYKDWDTPVL